MPEEEQAETFDGLASAIGAGERGDLRDVASGSDDAAGYFPAIPTSVRTDFDAVNDALAARPREPGDLRR